MGVKWSKDKVKGSKGTSTLGFRVPTTCDEKMFDDNR